MSNPGRERVKVIVTTRFNVVFTDDHFLKDKSGSPTRTEAWLKRRFELFEQVCLPSLQAQTDQDFEWLVFFSDGTPDTYKERIRSLQNQCPQLVPVFLYDGEYMVGRFKQEVAHRLTAHDTHLITLRIDNDDAFHRGMIARVREEFRGQDDELMNFVHGLQVDPDHGLAAIATEFSNPFLSRIERVRDGQALTVLDVRHTEAKDSKALRDIRTEPMWLQLIHGGNVTNRIDSGRYVFNVDLAKDFGVKLGFRVSASATWQALLHYWCVRTPKRMVRALLGR